MTRQSRSGEVLKILDSTRNRLKPYFESDILRHMFGATQSRLDVARFMREGKIVIFNLAPKNRLSSQLANTIGALVLNSSESSNSRRGRMPRPSLSSGSETTGRTGPAAMA